MKYLSLIILFLTSPLFSAEGRVVVLNSSGQAVHYSDLTIYLFKNADLAAFAKASSDRHYADYRAARDVYESVKIQRTDRRDSEFEEFGFRVSGGQKIVQEFRTQMIAAQKVIAIEKKFWVGVERIQPSVITRSKSGRFAFPVAVDAVLFAKTDNPLRIWVVLNPKDGVFLGEQNRSGSFLASRYLVERKQP